MMTQANTVFAMEVVGDTMVVTPQGDASGFRYNEIHNDTNSVIVQIDRQNAQNLVINFSKLQIAGSIMISSIIKMARKIGNKQGQAAFCNASEDMKEVMESMNLTRLWPYFESQDDAINSFESNS